MVLIKIKAGLDIPVSGSPETHAICEKESSNVAIDFRPYSAIKIKLLVKEGDQVQLGQQIGLDKKNENRRFVSHASGKVLHIIRGEKRKILSVVIERNPASDFCKLKSIDILQASKEVLIERLIEGGAFTWIKKRPCDLFADPEILPRSIFVQGIESAPFRPPPELVVKGNEALFAKGLQVLDKLVSGNVHLVTLPGSTLGNIASQVDIHPHSAIGPHPIANPSIHIEHIDPITSLNDIIWTLHVRDVIRIGGLMEGKWITHKLIALGGEALSKENRGYYLLPEGAQISQIVDKKAVSSSCAILSGDPLSGRLIDLNSFVGYFDNVISFLPYTDKRQILHFMRFSSQSYTATRAYFPSLFQKIKNNKFFNGLLHGEKRAFVDGTYYDRVMPLNVPTMPLLKALIAQDYEAATEMGLLEVAPEDFALTAFLCPSKIDHMGIVERGLHEYACQYL